jgi:hypothetical protein
MLEFEADSGGIEAYDVHVAEAQLPRDLFPASLVAVPARQCSDLGQLLLESALA